MSRIIPVVLCGGIGVRLWPLSREDFPKQCLSVAGDRSLLQDTMMRVADRSDFAAPIVVGSRNFIEVVSGQLQALGLEDALLMAEPSRRNTGPAVAAAANHVAARQPDALLLVMPADHAIRNVDAFLAAASSARGLAEDGRIVLFGVPPTRPETKYGYICPGEPVEGAAEAFRVVAFKEKPDSEAADRLCRQGYVWNSGIFLFSARTILDELRRFEPRIVDLARQAVEEALRRPAALELAETPFSMLPDTSIDHAVMERTDRAVVIPVDMGWSDLGTWPALADLAAKDPHGNALIGDAHALAASGCYLRSEGPLVAAIGVEDLIVVAMPDAVLVSSAKEQAKLAGFVEELRRRAHPAAMRTDTRHQSWGTARRLFAGPDCEVSRILVSPGQSLPLRCDAQRATHLTVVSGSGRLVADAAERALRPGDGVTIAPGREHVLTNAGEEPLELIEVVSNIADGGERAPKPGHRGAQSV